MIELFGMWYKSLSRKIYIVTYLLYMHINMWLGKKQQFQLLWSREKRNEQAAGSDSGALAICTRMI